MKIKKHLQIDAITNSTGRLPSDMENLTVYHHSSSKDEPINVGDMDLTYLIRAYAKCQRQLIKGGKIQSKDARQNSYVQKEAFQAMWDNCEKLKKDLKKTDDIVENNDKIYKKNLQEQEDKVLALSSKICNLLSIIEEKDELLDKQTTHTEHWRDAYYKSSTVKGEVKMFSEIPNDASGKAFVAQLKEYLNKESYKMRVRGQYLDEQTKKAEGWQKYERGQPIDKSKCLRIYVDTK